MPTHATSEISILTLSWINDQLREELARQWEEEPPMNVFWHRQVLTALAAGLSGVISLAQRLFA